MNRTDRLYALVEELRATAPRPQSARRLAERYEVSTRTIERDILALQESGVPIYAAGGRRGGYTLDKATTLPPLNFSPAEIVAIAVSLVHQENTPFAAAARSALRKVVAVASAARTAEASELMDRIRVVAKTTDKSTGGAPADRIEPGVPLAIQEAITARRVLRLEYRDRHGVTTSREVEPVAFLGNSGQWYLLAWCRLRDATRAFRVDRIAAVTDTGEPAPQRSYADLEVDIPQALLRRPDLVA